MRVPKVRHRVIKPVAKDLYLATDQRATDRSAFEGSLGGCGYEYFLHKEQRSTIQKECEKLSRRLSR